jgi:hypothetical protein
MNVWPYVMVLGVGGLATAACGDDGGGETSTGSGGAGATMTTTSTASMMTTTMTTGGGGNPPQFDTPGAASFSADFNIVDDMDGTFSVTGTWAIDLLAYENNTLGDTLCTEIFDFTADIDLPIDLQGCDENGANCTTICPFDDPTETINPMGACIGHFANLVGDVASYQTDCNFEMAQSWFHPSGGGMPLLERFFLSRPVEDAVPTGATMEPLLWGDWGQLLEDNNAGYLRALQVQFVNANTDPNSGDFLSWSENGFMFGATASPDGAEADVNAVGNHFMANVFVLVFN